MYDCYNYLRLPGWQNVLQKANRLTYVYIELMGFVSTILTDKSPFIIIAVATSSYVNSTV